MRKLKIALTILFAMSFSLFLFACGGGKAVQRIKVEGAKTTFTESEDFSAEGLTVQVQFKGEKEYETFKAEKGTVDATKKVIKYADFEVDYSAFVKGEAGEYDIIVTPDPEGQRKATPDIVTLASETYKVKVEHDYGAPDANGVEVCSVCQAEREIKTVNETVTTVAWDQPATIAAEGETLGKTVSDGHWISYGSIGIGQSARITMKVTADTGAVWNTPLMGIRNGDAGILPREDNWVIRSATGYTTPGNSTGSAASIGGAAEALNGAEWDIFVDGVDILASDYGTEGKEVEIFYNYRTDGVMEIRHTLNGGEKERVWHIKVPAAAYEIVCYGEKAVMNVTKVEYVRNLLLLDYTMSSGPAKKVYAENTMFDVSGIATTASYTRDVSSPITSYNLLADIDVEETTGEGAQAVTKTVTKTINLRTNKLIAGMKNFRLEFGGKKIELKDANAITVKASAIDRVYAGEFMYDNVMFSAENATYAYDVNGDGDVSVLVSGKADRLTATQKIKLNTEKDYYIAFRVMATKANALNDKLVAAFDDGSLADATVIKDGADGALNVILPVNANTASAVLNLSKGGTNLTAGGAIKIDLAGLEKVSDTTITSTVDANDKIYIDNGGSVKVTYYNIPSDTSKLGFTVGSRSATYEKVAAATADKPVALGSASVTNFVKEGNNVTVTYTFRAPALNNTITPSEFVISLTNDGKAVTTNTLHYTFGMSTDMPEGYLKVANNVYLKPDGAYLLVIAFLNGNDLQEKDLVTDVNVNIQNEIGTPYNLSVKYEGGAFVLAGANTVTNSKSTDIKATLVGTVGNADDFDYGATVVLRADLNVLGIENGDTYFFEIIDSTTLGYDVYKVNSDNSITKVEITNVGEAKGVKGDCLVDDLLYYEHKDGEMTFAFGQSFTAADGAHTYGADGVCTRCGTHKYGAATAKDLEIAKVTNATTRGITIGVNIDKATNDWTPVIGTKDGIFIGLPNLDCFWQDASCTIGTTTNAYPNGTPGCTYTLYNGFTYASFLNSTYYLTISVSPESGITYYIDGVKAVNYSASGTMNDTTVPTITFINYFLGKAESEGYVFAYEKNGAQLPNVANLTTYTATMNDQQVLQNYLMENVIAIGEKSFKISDMSTVEIRNIDESGDWWNGGTSDFAVPAGDFAIVYTWENTRDKNWHQDCVIELNAGTLFYDINTFANNPWGDLTTGTTNTCKYMIDGQVVTALTPGQGAEDTDEFYGGNYTVTIIRLGSTLYIHQKLINDDAVVVEVLNTVTNFTTDALMARLTGNPYWVDNITASLGSVEDVTPAE